MIYLDNAATSWPKPEGVAAAVQRWYREVGVSATRGDSELCRDAQRVVDGTRVELARMCGVPRDRIAFTSGATESLNLVLRGLLCARDAVLTTALEHASTARPLRHLGEELGLAVDVLPADAGGGIAVQAFEERLARRAYRLLVFSHASNVLGSVLDAAAICAAARRHGALSVVDASQSAGLLPLDVGADVLVASAHKSLLGPPGLGFVAVRPGIALRPVKQGGTGSARALDRQPEEWPAALEPGTPNTPAIFGLHAALEWHRTRGGTSLRHGLALVDVLRAQLRRRGDVRVLGPEPHEATRVPILSFTVDGQDPAETGALLDAAGIHVRTGFHCAPWVHEALGTSAAGTVRVSPGPFSTHDDVMAVHRALQRN